MRFAVVPSVIILRLSSYPPSQATYNLPKTQIDVVGANAPSGRIQPEQVVRVDVVPVVEPLTTPERDFRSTLEHVLHLREHLADTHVETITLSAPVGSV